MELDDEDAEGARGRWPRSGSCRKLADWSDPGIAGQDYSTFVPRFMKGEMGMLLMGGWAQGIFKRAGFKLSDYMVGPAPQDDGKIAFDLNSDEFIFWQKKQPEFQDGQKLLAKIVMAKEFGPMYLPDHRLDPGAHRHRPDAPRASATASARRRTRWRRPARANRVVLSLAHNMAQPNQITAAMIDVLTEYRAQQPASPRRRARSAWSQAVDNVR